MYVHAITMRVDASQKQSAVAMSACFTMICMWEPGDEALPGGDAQDEARKNLTTLSVAETWLGMDAMPRVLAADVIHARM